MSDIRLIYATPFAPAIRERIMQLVESGRLPVNKTPMTYAQLSAESRGAAIAARRNGDPAYVSRYAKEYLRFERLKRAALRELFL